MTKNLINQGRTAEVFDIGNNQILKLYRRDFPIQGIEKELNISTVINDYNLPIPKFLGKVEQDGRIGLIFEKISGLSMLRMIMLNPLTLFLYAKQMAEIHSIIHKTKVSGVPQQKEQLEFFINNSMELPAHTKSMIINMLKKLPSDNYLCHGDLHPENILYPLKGNPVVIDWMTATTGNPAGDVARTKVILKYSKAPQHLPFMTRLIANLFKSALCNTYDRHYIKITGMSSHEIHEWELPVAAARLCENGPKEEKEALTKLIHRELKNRKL